MKSFNNFSECLRLALQTAGLSQRDFANKAGISRGFPPLLLAGKRTPPLECINAWCRVLHLAPGTPERIAFERAAYLSHAPEEVRQMVDDLEAKLTQAQQQFSLLVTELRSLNIQLPESITDI